jgi:hypothetical protein
MSVLESKQNDIYHDYFKSDKGIHNDISQINNTIYSVANSESDNDLLTHMDAIYAPQSMSSIVIPCAECQPIDSMDTVVPCLTQGDVVVTDITEDNNALTGDQSVACAVLDLDAEVSLIEGLMDESYLLLVSSEELEYDSFFMEEDAYICTPSCTCLDEDILIEEFNQELQSITDEFTVISGICLNTFHEDHTVDSVVDVVVSCDENVGDNTLDTLDASVPCEEVQKGGSYVQLSAAAGWLQRTAYVLDVLCAVGVTGDELLLRGVALVQPRWVFDPGGTVMSA